MDPNIKSEGRTSLNNNNCNPTTCGSPPANIIAPVKGLQVFIDSCLICNSQSYLCPKDSQNETSRQRTIELRSAFYSLFEIPVPDSFIRSTSEEIPFCSGCTFKLGRLKMLYEQLEALQKEFGKMKEEIAFSIVDVVAASGETEGWGPPDLRSLPNLTLQRYLKQAEVDTLQRFVFDEWHDKSSSEDYCASPPQPVVVNKPPTTPPVNPVRPKIGTNTTSASSTGNKVFSGSMQPPQGLRKIIPRPPLMPSRGPPGRPSRLPMSPMLPSVNRNPGIPGVSSKVNFPMRSEQRPGQKTTVISITTPETRVAKRVNNGNHSTPNLTEAGKRKAEVPTGISNVTKKLKCIPGINETDLNLRGAETSVGRRAEVGRGSPPMKLDEEGGSGLEISLDEGDDQTEEYDPTDMEITKVDSGDSRESNASPEDGRTSQGADIHGESSTSPGNMAEEIDFYEGMSLSELANFVTEEDPDLAEGQDGADEDVDPERQKYLENIIAQLQAGGSNIEFQQNEEGLYVCMFCNKTFIHKYPYRDHLKTHTGEGPRCPVCNKIFPKNHNLMLHLRTHTGEKPFQCDVCHKGFADKSNLKVHYRVHTGEKPYKCDFCNLAFVNSSRLVVHRRLHTGERPFACEYCGKSFATPNQLQSHEKIHKASGTSSD